MAENHAFDDGKNLIPFIGSKNRLNRTLRRSPLHSHPDGDHSVHLPEPKKVYCPHDTAQELKKLNCALRREKRKRDNL